MKKIKALWNVACVMAAGLVLFANTARADMTIEIVGGGANRHPVAIVPFGLENALPGGLSAIINSDLARTGEFRMIDTKTVANQPVAANQIDWPAWAPTGAMAIAVGRVVAQNAGQVTVEFSLVDAARKQVLTSSTFSIAPNQSRALAHTIADMIYQALTGQRGLANTKIAYVLKQGKMFSLQVADSDGGNPQTILRSSEPIISPTWSPDGGRLAYVSFETKKPVVYVHMLANGYRKAVASFKGSNSAPAFSPDGSRLAVVLTGEGNSQIYQIPADGGAASRLSFSQGIDTEPAYSADGSRILFTSDRAGGPQVYAMSASGGAATRLTYEGNYNVSPAVSPDNQAFAFVRREGGRYKVMLQEFGGGPANQIGTGPYDESPSFAPNGKLVLYASESGGRGVLYTVSRDGQTRTKLTTPGGEIRAPAWGPFPPR